MVGDTSNDLGIILTSYSKPASTASSIYVSLQQQGDRKEGQHEWNVSPSRGLALTSLHGTLSLALLPVFLQNLNSPLLNHASCALTGARGM